MVMTTGSSSAGLAAGLGLALGMVGCGGAPPPPAPKAEPVAAAAPPAPPEPPSKEPIDTGSECAKAEAQCGGGACLLTVDNACDQAVSCDATMVTTCKSGTSMVEAARRKRETYAAKSQGELSLQGNCPDGEILATAMKSLACK